MKWSKPVAVLSALLLFLSIFPRAFAAGTEQTNVIKKSTLVFSLDQAFGNGIVVHNDQVALQRIIDAILPLQAKYDVYVLLNPMVANKSYVTDVLDTLTDNGVPFVLDAISSDAETLGSCTMEVREGMPVAFNAPEDAYHGITIDLSEVEAYKTTYGSYFAGMRFMELFHHDWAIRAVQSTNPEWAEPCWKLPEDGFFHTDLAEPYIQFAHEHDMFVEWADLHWFTFRPWDPPQEGHEQELADLASKYPDTIVVTYDNNEAGAPATRLNDWHTAVTSFVQDGARGIGLSNQSWMTDCGFDDMNCPVSNILTWTLSGLEQELSFVQFEPAWYFFELPRGSFGYEDYTTDTAWAGRGNPTANFTALYNLLMDETSWHSGSALHASEITTTSVKLTWDNATAAAYYRILKDGNLVTRVKREQLDYTISGLSPGQSYLFQVQAGNADGTWSTSGPSLSVTTGSDSPVIIDTGSGNQGTDPGKENTEGEATSGGSASVPGSSVDTSRSPSSQGEPLVKLNDIAIHWAYQAIQRAIDEGWVKGYEDATFRPDQATTRAEFITLLHRAIGSSGSSAESGSNAFKDGKDIPKWAMSAMTYAIEAGWVIGDKNGNLHPNGVITRAEMAVILARVLKLELESLSNGVAWFKDGESIPVWAVNAVYAMAEQGLLSGRGSGKFDPQGHLSRAEAVTVLLRTLDLKAKQ